MTDRSNTTHLLLKLTPPYTWGLGGQQRGIKIGVQFNYLPEIG